MTSTSSKTAGRGAVAPRLAFQIGLLAVVMLLSTCGGPACFGASLVNFDPKCLVGPCARPEILDAGSGQIDSADAGEAFGMEWAPIDETVIGHDDMIVVIPSDDSKPIEYAPGYQCEDVLRWIAAHPH